MIAARLPYGLLCLAAALAGCSEPRWEGHIYPSRNNLATSRQVGTYPTLEECRDAAERGLRDVQSDTSRGDYECGLNCRAMPDSTMRVCEATER